MSPSNNDDKYKSVNNEHLLLQKIRVVSPMMRVLNEDLDP